MPRYAKVVSVKVTDEIQEEIRRLCKERGEKSISRLMRRILRAYLKKYKAKV